jgi:hypothetical protein
MRDPLLRTVNAAINIEEAAVNIAGSFTLAAIGAAETAARLVLRLPAAVERARELGEEVVPRAMHEIEETVEEWSGVRFAA